MVESRQVNERYPTARLHYITKMGDILAEYDYARAAAVSGCLWLGRAAT